MDVLTQTGHLVNQTFAAAFSPPTPVYGADLYTGTDPSSLNFLEKAWMNWYLWWGNPVIATGVMSFLLHEVRVQSALIALFSPFSQIIYFGRAIPFVIIDAMPSMRKYKLQEV